MLRVGGYLFKRAETPDEMEQIHRLNYRTFVGEVPQHPDPGTGRLVDKFHTKNTYFIALYDGRVIGMLSVHDKPPFSVAERLPDPSVLQQPGSRPLEVRLLAVEPGRRHSTVIAGLGAAMLDYAKMHGYTHLYISGIQDRLDMYRDVGFEPLGPAVRCGSVAFVPMVATVSPLPARLERIEGQWRRRLERVGRAGAVYAKGKGATPDRPLVCLLPGPVTTAPAVRDAFHQPPLYHRGPEFIDLFDKVRRTLGRLVNGRDVAIMNGSGTLANEAVAAALAAGAQPTRGVLLVNGEFGERLARQAGRFGLQPRVLRWPWGQPWDLDDVATALDSEPPGTWVWGVHLESSTGVLNDLPGLVRVARTRGARVCLDCISSIGAVPVDLRDVYLATAATGKSLGAYAGAAIVFADARVLEQLDMARVPSYLDVVAALGTEGPRYTFPSPTLRALDAALAFYETPEKARTQYERYHTLGGHVRRELRRLGLEPIADEACACPVVTTFAPPADESAEAFVARCRSWGFAIGGQSGYLKERRLVQIATMGAVTIDDCRPLFDHLDRWLAQLTARAVG